MDNLLAITLTANNSNQNHHRFYNIRIGRDLFGDWTMICQFGRAGTRGREVHHAAMNIRDLQRLLQISLKRRLSAPKRIGCPYELTEFSIANDPMLESCFPRELTAAFPVQLPCY